jgi:hypothetical protein
LQLEVSDVTPHDLPPSAVALMIERARVLVPLPQDKEHVPQLPQLLCTQSTGHASMLQGRYSVADGHALPPVTGSVLLRRNLISPLPHVRLHTPLGS